MRKMKVIFLDIDGVLNYANTPNPRKFPYVVDPQLLRSLKNVVAATGAHMVLSSTWRYDPAGLFSARRCGVPFESVLPDRPGQARREEILEWLGEHPEATRFAVIETKTTNSMTCHYFSRQLGRV